MEIQDIKGKTRTVGEAQGYLGLPIRDEVITDSVNGPGTPCMVTAWRPTEDEMRLIAGGAPILVRILGRVPPPMMLYVEPA